LKFNLNILYPLNSFLDAKYWIENGKRMLEEKAKLQLRTNKAKNVIIFMGDGMSLTTLTAARIYKGQLQNTTGESEHLSFEQFPFTGISKVRIRLQINFYKNPSRIDS